MADLTAKPLPPRQRLWKALADEDVHALAAALAAKANPNARYGSWTPFGKALRQHRGTACARLLLEAGADPNAPDTTGALPLTAACRLGKLDLIDPLLAAGARPEFEALLAASQAGVAEAVERLLQRGSPVADTAERSRQVIVALEEWRHDHGEPPHALVAATLALPRAHPAIHHLLHNTAHRRVKRVWEALCACPEHLQDVAPDMAAAAAEFGWREGLEQVLAVAPDAPAMELRQHLVYAYPGTVVASALSGLAQCTMRRGGHRQAWDLLERVLEAGFSPHLPATTNSAGHHAYGQDGWAEVPVLLHALRLYRGTSAGRRRLMARLVNAGLAADDTGKPGTPFEGYTAGHLLAEQGDAATFSWAVRRWPNARWETPRTGILVHLIDQWKTDDAKQRPLAELVTAFGDADPAACDGDGRTPLHALAERMWKGRVDKWLEPQETLPVVAALIRLGSPVDTQMEGWTAVERVAGRYPELAEAWRHLLLARTLSDQLPPASPAQAPRRPRF